MFITMVTNQFGGHGRKNIFTSLAMVSLATNVQDEPSIERFFLYFYTLILGIILGFQCECFLDFMIYFVARQTLINHTYFTEEVESKVLKETNSNLLSLS